MWVGDPARNIAPWRDTGIEIRGPAVAEIARAFAGSWALDDGLGLSRIREFDRVELDPFQNVLLKPRLRPLAHEGEQRTPLDWKKSGGFDGSDAVTRNRSGGPFSISNKRALPRQDRRVPKVMRREDQLHDQLHLKQRWEDGLGAA